jgi:hypothetical protein
MLVKKRAGWSVAAVLLVGVLVAGCGQGSNALKNISSLTSETVHADGPTGFTPSSKVTRIDDDTYFIGVEAVLPPGFSKWSLPFQLPPGRSITSVQGTISHRSSCFSQALGVIAVDGHAMPTIVKLGNNGGASTVFVNYSIPVQYTNGEAAILLEADPVSTCSGTTTWEFQGMLRVQ